MVFLKASTSQMCLCQQAVLKVGTGIYSGTFHHIFSHIYRTIPNALPGTGDITTQSSRSKVPEIMIAWTDTFPISSGTDSLVRTNPIVTTIWNKRIYIYLCSVLVNSKSIVLVPDPFQERRLWCTCSEMNWTPISYHILILTYCHCCLLLW